MRAEKGERGERMMMAGLLAVVVVLTAALLILPGREGLEQRMSLLVMPWGGLIIGFGLLWLTRNPHREALVGKVLLGAALLMGAGLGVAASLG